MLTEKAIAQAKPKEKIYRMYDEHGLYLEISTAGGKWWRLRYRFRGKENRVSLGTYPLVSLKEARDRAWEARKGLELGVAPKKRRVALGVGGATFENLAREWWKKFMEPNGGRYPGDVMRRMEREVFPHIGGMSATEIDAPAILAILRRIEGRGTIETAHKIKSYISQTLRYGIASGVVSYNPARDLGGAIAPKRKKHMAAIIDPKAAGALMRSIDGYSRGQVRCALLLAALTFVRPGELRTAEWPEIDFESGEWRIPAEKMKMKRPHIVPLSRQSLEVLRVLQQFSGAGKYLFPSVRSADRPMSDMTVNAALRALGYGQDEMTGHGFRAMANSLLAEMGCWSIDAIERQLAHVEKNQVRSAYHRSEHLEERRRMMQTWADYLDELRAGM